MDAPAGTATPIQVETVGGRVVGLDTVVGEGTVGTTFGTVVVVLVTMFGATVGVGASIVVVVLEAEVFGTVVSVLHRPRPFFDTSSIATAGTFELSCAEANVTAETAVQTTMTSVYLKNPPITA